MAVTRIRVNNNGSLRVEGEFVVTDAEGREYGPAGRTSISLCRCGHSQNRPFCDGSHRTSGFESVCQAFEMPAPKSPS